MSSVDTLNREFQDHVRAIMYNGVKLKSAVDRVRVMQWLKRLRDQNDRSLETCIIRNQYAQALRIMVGESNGMFCRPFKEPPPEDELIPLLEALSNSMHSVVPDLPKCGPLKPILFHRSADHRAYLSIKRCPEGGIFCYMAVAPEPLQFGQLTKRKCGGNPTQEPEISK